MSKHLLKSYLCHEKSVLKLCLYSFINIPITCSFLHVRITDLTENYQISVRYAFADAHLSCAHRAHCYHDLITVRAHDVRTPSQSIYTAFVRHSVTR